MGSVIPICTAVSKNYLAHARSLARSYLDVHPDGQVFLCLIDTIDDFFDPANEPFTIISMDKLNIPNWDCFAFQYTVIELCCAVRPYFLTYLMDTYQLDRLAFFDADIVIYHSLATLDRLLDTYGVVLTPHICNPLNDDRRPSEVDLLGSGIYNLGFLAISRRTDLDGLLGWWKARLYHHCKLDFARGLFYDQRWMDLAPAMFPNVYIWQTPAANIAEWNLAHRHQNIAQTDGQYTIDGEPILFVHYSGLVFDQFDNISKHQNRYRLSDLNEAVQSLWHGYRNRLITNGYHEISQWPYTYARFDNGLSIPTRVRDCYWETDPRGERWPHPFAVGGDSFFEYLNAPEISDSTLPDLTNLAVYLYRHTPDVIDYFPGGLSFQRRALIAWFGRFGSQRFTNLDEAFFRPMSLANPSEVSAIEAHLPRPADTVPPPPLTPFTAQPILDQWQGRVDEALTPPEPDPASRIENLMQRLRRLRIIGPLLIMLNQVLRTGAVWEAQRKVYDTLIAQHRADQREIDVLTANLSNTAARLNNLEAALTEQMAHDRARLTRTLKDLELDSRPYDP